MYDFLLLLNLVINIPGYKKRRTFFSPPFFPLNGMFFAIETNTQVKQSLFIFIYSEQTIFSKLFTVIKNQFQR